MSRKRHASGDGITLKYWHRKLLYSASLLVGLTGLLWFGSHDLLQADPNDFQRTMLILHGAGSFLATMAFGSMLPNHFRIGLKLKRNLVSGIAIFSVFAVLIVSAFLLYYGSEDYRDFDRWLHIILGIGAFAVLPIHIYFGRRSAAARSAKPR